MAIDATVANATQEGAAQSKQPIKLTVSGIIMDLENGLDRTAIATKYGLSSTEVNEVFKHPKLKGLRAKRKITRITLIDDTDDAGNATSALVQETFTETVTDPNQTSLLDEPVVMEKLDSRPEGEVDPEMFNDFNN
jgi:hypothetical protein